MLEAVCDPCFEPQPKLAVRLARGESEVLDAQRLRYRVFAEELGARLPGAAPIGLVHTGPAVRSAC